MAPMLDVRNWPRQKKSAERKTVDRRQRAYDRAVRLEAFSLQRALSDAEQRSLDFARRILKGEA